MAAKRESIDTKYDIPDSYLPLDRPFQSQRPAPKYDDPHSGMNQKTFVSNTLQGLTAAEAAFLYGTRIMGTSKELVDEKLRQCHSVNNIKHYFAVNSNYVYHKLLLLLFPFNNQDWSRKFVNSVPEKPMYDINSPDLYIPLMGFVTYLLIFGVLYGLRSTFNIEYIVVLASEAAVSILLEVTLELVLLYIANIQTQLNITELTAFAGYKFVGVIVTALLFLTLSKKGYYAGLVYCSAAMAFFKVRSLRLQILSTYDDSDMNAPQSFCYPGVGPVQSYQTPRSAIMEKRQHYFLIAVAIAQPIFMWWLTYNLGNVHRKRNVIF